MSDPAKANAGYAALLGIQPQTGGACYVGFGAEGQQIGLVPGSGPQGMTSPVALWHVADIVAKPAEVTAAGAGVHEPVRDVGDGRLVATIADPDGNVLGRLHNRRAREEGGGLRSDLAARALPRRDGPSGSAVSPGTTTAKPH